VPSPRCRYRSVSGDRQRTTAVPLAGAGEVCSLRRSLRRCPAPHREATVHQGVEMLPHGVLMHAEFRGEPGDRRRRPGLLQAFQDGGPLTGQPRSRRGAPHRRRAEGPSTLFSTVATVVNTEGVRLPVPTWEEQEQT